MLTMAVMKEELQPARKRARKFFVHVNRPEDVEKARRELPVCMHEQEIIEAIHANDVVLISAATGTGKTTQVPQFLVEDGFGDKSSLMYTGKVAVTQPRRVAAVSCAERVAYEMGTSVGGVVGYQIRHKRRLGDDTRVKFVTDGILLREVEKDILLRNYSAVVIDEVHERSMNTDLLLSFLSRSVKMRKAKEKSLGRLKIIIMSATLQIEGVFSGDKALFPDPPVLKIPSRQYPVTVHFAKRTSPDYVDEAFKKVCKIHRRLPPGGVLVFLSGRQEVDSLCEQIQDEFGDTAVKIPECEEPLSIKVLPFYALLSDDRQKQVFEDIPENVRKIVVATNIAETSVTVPGVSYVVDSGRVKEKVYSNDSRGALTSYEIRWVSQAAAEQRAGRAGRIGPGHCYRLYSSAVFDQQFDEFKEPEILTVPADSVVLRLRAMGILKVNQFPFPTAPSKERIIAAEELLTRLGALGSGKNVPSLRMLSQVTNTQCTILGVTDLGRELSKLPLPPRFGKMLLAAHSINRVLPYACRLAGILSVGTVVDKMRARIYEWPKNLQHTESDLLTELAAVCAVEHSGRGKEGTGKLNVKKMREICVILGLHLKSILEALSISDQLCHMFYDATSCKALEPMGGDVKEGIIRSFVSGFGDQIARRMTRHEAASMGVAPRQQRRAFVVSNCNEPVFLEGFSPVALGTNTEFICFSDLVRVERRKKKEDDANNRDDFDEEEEVNEMEDVGKEENENEHKKNSDDKGVRGTAEEREEIAKATAKGGASETKLVARGATVVKRIWIVEEATSMVSFQLSSAVQNSEAKYSKTLESVCETVVCNYGNHHWPLGNVALPVPIIGRLTGNTSRNDTQAASQAMVFATALLNGSISATLQLPDASRKCLQAVAHVLKEYGVASVSTLKRVRGEGGVGAVVEACGWDGWAKKLDLFLSGWEAEKLRKQISIRHDDQDENGYE